MTGDIQSKFKELRRMIENLQGEISTLKERMDDIKPFAVFAKEMEERDEYEESLKEEDTP